MERAQCTATRITPSALNTADRARELWRMKMASNSHVVISVTPQTLLSQQRGSSASTLVKPSYRHNNTSPKDCNTPVYEQQRTTSQIRPLTRAALLDNQDEYYGGESLWCEDVQEEISTVSYRATRMTESVKRLFAEISMNARPLRKGDTRDLIYLAKERYEKEMEADYCTHQADTSNGFCAAKSAPKSTYSSDNHIANNVGSSITHDDTVNPNYILSRTSSTKSRSASKQAVLRHKLELFPRSRAGSRASQAETEHAEHAEQSASNLAIRAASTGSPNIATKQLTPEQLATCNESSPLLELTFKKAFLYAKHHLSQWIRRSKE